MENSSDKMKKFICRPNYPSAIPNNLFADQDSDHSRLQSAHMFLDQHLQKNITNEKILQFFCNTGEIACIAARDWSPSLSLGYDTISMGWQRYTQDDHLQFTTSLEEVFTLAPYDTIIANLHDLEQLKLLESLLSPQGHLYLRCIPWTSRYGMGIKNARIFNKAFAHLFLSHSDLLALGCTVSDIFKVTKQDTYYTWFTEVGFKIRNEKIVKQDLESIFRTTVLSSILKEVCLSNLYEEYCSINHIDYVLVK